MTGERRLPLSRALVWLAGAAGCVHAGFSLSWALGGRWLLETVGLGGVALVKLLAALVPVAVADDRVPGRRLRRALSWAGGSLLVVYGGVNVVVGNLVLSGVIEPAGGDDAAAMKGHALLWDPPFLLWGGALVLSLWMSRPGPTGTPVG